MADRIKLAYTPAIFAEYAQVITAADRKGVLLKVRHCDVLVKPAAVPGDDSPDVDVSPFVAAALATEERVIITLKPGDFEPATRHRSRVISSTQAKRDFCEGALCLLPTLNQKGAALRLGSASPMATRSNLETTLQVWPASVGLEFEATSSFRR